MALAFVNSASSNGLATVTMPTGLSAGMLAVLFDESVNNTATIPTSVTPAGWTAASTSVSGTFTGGTQGARFNISFKILVGTESGATVTGMAAGGGAGFTDKIVVVFSGTAGSFGTPLSVLSGLGSPPTSPLAISNVTAAGVMLGCAVNFAGGSIAGLSMTPAATANQNDGSQMETGYILYNSASASNSVARASTFTGDGSLAGLWVPFTDTLMSQIVM